MRSIWWEKAWFFSLVLGCAFLIGCSNNALSDNSDSFQKSLTGASQTISMSAATDAAQVSRVSSSISADALIAGQVQTAKVTLSSQIQLQNLIVDIRIYNSANQMIARKPFEGVSIAAGSSISLQHDFQISSNQQPGQYNVQVGVWDSTWQDTYYYDTIAHFSVSAAGSTAPTPGSSLETGIYKLMPRLNTSFCIDIATNNNSDHVYIWECGQGNKNQEFEYTNARELRIHGKCLDAYLGRSGDPLTVYDCHGGENQKFTYDSVTGLIRTVNNLCVDVYAGGIFNRNYLKLYSCDANNANQRFDVLRLSSSAPTPSPSPTPAPTNPTGLFNIRSQINNGFCADIDAQLVSNGARVYIYQCVAGTANQAFDFTSNNEIKIHGKCLDSAGAANGSPLTVYDCHGGSNQKFTYDSSTGLIRGINNLCVDVYAGQMVNRTYLNMYSCDPNNRNQKFTLTQAQVTTPAPVPVPTPSPSTPISSGDYPFYGQKLFASQYNGAAYNAANYCPAQMSRIAAQPRAVWLAGDIHSINNDMPQFFSQAASQNATMILFILYNIPYRDCGLYSAGGIAASEYGAWVEAVAKQIGNRKAAVIIEPDALSMAADTSCLNQTLINERISLIRNAVMTLRNHAPNTAIYLDAGSPVWVPAPQMAQLLKSAGVDYANGFSLNVSGYVATDVNVNFGNMLSALVGGNKHFVIDTSRNGNGGTTPYQWCNPQGQAIGPVPQAFNTGLVDAYVWANMAGSSDGSCGQGFPNPGVFMPQWACDMAYRAGW